MGTTHAAHVSIYYANDNLGRLAEIQRAGSNRVGTKVGARVVSSIDSESSPCGTRLSGVYQ